MFNPNLNNILLADVKDLKELGFLTEELDEILIPNAIKFIQDSKIQNSLGTKLYTILLEQTLEKYDNQSYTIPDKYLILLDNYIFYAIGYFVNAELLIPLTNKLRNKGVINTGDDRVDTIDYNTLRSSVNHYNDRGEFYVDLVIRYINQNIDDYPEFYDCTTYDKKSDKKTFKSPIYIPKNK